jgi:hypothetical protein
MKGFFFGVVDGFLMIDGIFCVLYLFCYQITT